ncbi:MAG: Trk family potassium uptake protein [Lachnospiraceae bacterium]|nr:Trk family potassium uptake protein [Lachnospiraceae bacterium]
MSGRIFGKKWSSFQIIIMGFLAAIFIGALLLTLPAASRAGRWTPFYDTLFTAVSAVCVTGLVVRDTASHWSGFGQGVILLLIQLGGLGVVFAASFVAAASGRKASIFQRSLLKDSISAHQIGGVVQLASFVFKMTFLTELSGALLLLPAFCGRYGFSGVWLAVFHSVSAFCNAGFDLLGDKTGSFSSLTSFSGDIGIVLPVCALIAIGGLGFLTWEDIAEKGFRFKRYRMQSKVILITTAVLILLPALFLFWYDFSAYPLKERFLLSLFQAVTPRTAGFNTFDYAAMSGSGRILTIFLMLIGGSPGSTAGGIKTTTAAVLLANAAAAVRRRKNPELFRRRIEESALMDAAALMVLYVFFTLFGALLISAAERLPVAACLFETASAIGTVGLSLGITPALGSFSRLLLMLLMFFGRVGGLTLLGAAVSKSPAEAGRYPLGKINVG